MATSDLYWDRVQSVKLAGEELLRGDPERPAELDIIVRKNRQGRLGQVTTRIDGGLRYLAIARCF